MVVLLTHQHFVFATGGRILLMIGGKKFQYRAKVWVLATLFKILDCMLIFIDGRLVAFWFHALPLEMHIMIGFPSGCGIMLLFEEFIVQIDGSGDDDDDGGRPES